MPILDEILGFFRKPRPAPSNAPTEHVESVLKYVRSDSFTPGKQQVKIVVTLDMILIHHGKRHQGPGIFGYSCEENAAIGVMNKLVAAGIPMDWKHFIEWRDQSPRSDALSFERFMPTRGRITFMPDLGYSGVLHVTWKA